MASFRACDKCARSMVVMVASGKPHWRCEMCPAKEELEDDETLIVEGRGDAAAISRDPSLFRQYMHTAGQDPTAVKVHGWCRKCKKETVMTRAFLGEDEQVLYGCPCGENYQQKPVKPAAS